MILAMFPELDTKLVSDIAQTRLSGLTVSTQCLYTSRLKLMSSSHESVVTASEPTRTDVATSLKSAKS